MADEYPLPPSKYSNELYLRLLSTWPWTQKDHPKQIAIIGAGMSGLTCGWLLRKAGHDVTIFEASNRPGGRVKTLRDRFTRGFYAEAGAMRIPSTHTLTLQLVADLKIDKHSFENRSAHNIVFINGIRHTRQECSGNPYAFGFPLKSYEIDTDAKDLFEKCIKTYVARTAELNDFKSDLPNFPFDLPDEGGPSETALWRTKFYEQLDKFSLRQFLMEEAFLSDNKTMKLSQAGSDFITSLLVYDMHLPSSMAAILGDYNELFSEKIELYQLEGGMDHLPMELFRLAEPSKNKRSEGKLQVRYNCRATAIEATNQDLGVSVFYENPIARHAQDLPFHLAVIAIPFSALRHVQTHGLMSTGKRKAVRQLHYDNSCKILIEFSKMFWNPRKIGGGSSITDLPVRQIHYPGKLQNQNKSNHGVLLASYTWGEDSLRWTSLSQYDRIRFAIRDLERVHHLKDNELTQLCTGGMSHSWAEDEFTGGAFAMFEPYQSGMFGDIWRPEGRLHYCGEHTSMKHGWIEGAVQSGIRAANEICTRLNRDRDLSADDVTAPAGH